LKGFEHIKGVILDPLPFDMERDLVTATLKKKRNNMLKYYKVFGYSLSFPLLRCCLFIVRYISYVKKGVIRVIWVRFSPPTNSNKLQI